MQPPRRLSILFLATWYPDERRPTHGVFVREHARAAALRNDVVVLHAEPDPDLAPGRVAVAERVEEGGLRVLRIRYGARFARFRGAANREGAAASAASAIPAGGWLGRVARLAAGWFGDRAEDREVRAAVRALLAPGGAPRFDVIHAHVYAAGRAGLAVARELRAPLIVTEHWSGFPRGLLSRWGRAKARRAFEGAAVVLPVGRNLAGHLRMIAPRARFEVVPNVVDEAIFHPRASDPRAVAGGGESGAAPRLLCVAGLVPVKGVEHLLRALPIVRRRRPGTTLEVVGDGPDRASLEALARELGAGEATRFLGYRPKPFVAERMRGADLYVQPSEWENLPCAVLEALSCGTPVVASDVGGLSEAFSSGGGDRAGAGAPPRASSSSPDGILVSPRDPKALAEAILEGLRRCDPSEPDAWDRPGIAARARERFSMETVGARLDRIYRETLAGG